MFDEVLTCCNTQPTGASDLYTMASVRYAIKVGYGEDVFSFPFVDNASTTLFDDFIEQVSSKIGGVRPTLFTYEDDTGDQITVKDSEDLRWGLDQARLLQDQNAFPRLKIVVKNPALETTKKNSKRSARQEPQQENGVKHDVNGHVNNSHENNSSDEGSDWSPAQEKTTTPTKRYSHSSSSSTFFETAIAVLRKTRIPMTAGQVTKFAIENGLLKTTGKTPKNTMSAMFSETLRKRSGCPFRAFREINAYGLKELEYDESSSNHKRKIEEYAEENAAKVAKWNSYHDESSQDEMVKQNKDEPNNESHQNIETLSLEREMPETPVKGDDEDERMEPDAIY